MTSRRSSEKITTGKHHFYMGGFLLTSLDILKRRLKRNKDALIIVVGEEGDGKSTLAAQIGVYLDHTLTLDRVAFDGDSYIDMIQKAKPGQAVIFDEAVTGMMATDSMRSINKKIVKALVLCRKRRLFMILCIPDPWLLQWYPIRRARMLVRVKEHKPGDYRLYIYNRKKLRAMWQTGKRGKHKYYATALKDKFVSYFPFEEAKYDRKKDKGWESALAEDSSMSNLQKKIRYHQVALIELLKKQHGWQVKDLATYLTRETKFPITASGISKLTAAYSLRNEV